MLVRITNYAGQLQAYEIESFDKPEPDVHRMPQIWLRKPKVEFDPVFIESLRLGDNRLEILDIENNVIYDYVASFRFFHNDVLQEGSPSLHMQLEGRYRGNVC